MPLKRYHEGAERDDVTVAIRHRDKRRMFYFNWTKEMELELKNNNPGMFESRVPKRRSAFADPAVSKLIDRNLDEFIQPNSGGFVTVDYGEDSLDQHDSGMQENTALNTGSDGLKSMDLCHLCQEIIKESKILNREKPIQETDGQNQVHSNHLIEWTGPKFERYEHYGKLGLLKLSALAGCHLCSLIDAPDPGIDLQYDENSVTPYVLKVIYGKLHSEGPGVIVLEPPRRLPSRAINLMWGKSPDAVSSTLTQTRTNAQPILELGQKWLSTCIESHDLCRKRSSAPVKFTPTRLLKVKASGTSIQSINLVLGRHLPENAKYLTLSHCWGGADIVKLTNATFAPFQSDIPPSCLPQNFVDSLIITSLLGYEYIWIDSLCIIQDSVDDWKEEAARMGAVYRHSDCTIAAAGAKDSHGGCFMDRSYFSFIPCQLTTHSAELPGVYADLKVDPHSHSALHTRAWVVQERCLSIRTLNFGATTLSWDCIQASASEQEPGMLDTSYDTSLKRTFNDLLGATGPHWNHAWWKLVGEYSSCNLTFSTDKWAAVKGLATEIEGDCGLHLVHGLWAQNLADELLWTVDSPRAARLDIGAPSWSWLGVQGRVWKRRFENDRGEHRLDAMVVPPAPLRGDTQVLGSRSDQYEGGITVTGRMLPIRWAIRAQVADAVPTFNFRFLDGRPAPGSGPPVWDGRWIPDTAPDESWEAWSLQLVKSADTRQWKSRAGLVVVRVGGGEGRWRRVGFYEIGWRGGSHADANLAKRFFGFKETVVLI